MYLVAFNLLNKPLKIGPLSSVVNSLEHVAQVIVSIRCIAMYVAPSWVWQVPLPSRVMVFFLFSSFRWQFC